MMRKIALLLAAMLLSATVLSARPHPDRYSPYQYGYRWYFSFQGGPVLSFTDNIQTYGQNGQAWDMLCWHAALSFGYNFTDAWDLRISGAYGYNAGAMLPYAGFYPYHYFAASKQTCYIWSTAGDVNETNRVAWIGNPRPAK